MLGRKQKVKSRDSSFKVSKVNKRKRRAPTSNDKSYLPSTSVAFHCSDMNTLRVNSFSNVSPLLSEQREEIQLLDSAEHPVFEEWTRRVRSIDKDTFAEASTSSNNIEYLGSCYGTGDQEKLHSTDIWRNMMFYESDKGPRLKSEEIFKEHLMNLLKGIDLAISNPAAWSENDSNWYFNVIQNFPQNWSQELLKEKKLLDDEVSLAKDKVKTKYDLVTNRLKVLTSVFEKSGEIMNFSVGQKKAIESQMSKLNAIKIKLVDCEVDNLVLQKALLTNNLKERDRELEVSQKQADEFREELTKTQNKLANIIKEKDHELELSRKQADKCREELSKAQNELANFLKEKDRESEPSRVQTDECREELKQTQSKLKAVKAELNKRCQKTRLEQNEMQDKLSEIRSMLAKNHDSVYHSDRYFTGDLYNKNKLIINDIKSIIQYKKESTEVEIIEVPVERMQNTSDSCILRVTENEIHLLTLVASFLKVTPFPVGTQFIYTYVSKIDNVVELKYVEMLLKKFPSIFKEEAMAPGSTEIYWSYLDLKPIITI